MNTVQKAVKGSVGIETFQERLRLRLPRQICGNNNRYITLGLADTPENRKLAEQKAHQIELDIQADCFDETLSKYKQQRHLSIVNPKEPQKVLSISELWDRYIDYKRQSLKPRTLDKLAVLEKHIKRCRYQLLDEAIKIRIGLLQQTTNSQVKDVLMYLSAACKWGIKVNNQIVVKEYNCQTDSNGVVWIQFSGLKKGKILRIPTTLTTGITGQFRLIKRSGKWYIHYGTDMITAPKRNEGIDIGVDRGYSEVYATSSNDGARFIGSDFGSKQTNEVDYRHEKGKRRHKIRAIAAKAKAKGNHTKALRIKNNNLGRIKWNSRESSFKGRIKTLVFTATVELMHNAIKSVAFEGLTEQFTSKAKRSKRTKRNLSSWCKGIVADALSQVSSRVGCTIVSVSAAHTSQLDLRYGVLLGIRSGDKFTCFDGVVMQSDTNAADNIRARMGDVEIPRFMKHTDVKKILLERTQKFQDTLVENLGATTGEDKPKTLEPKRKRTSRVNQRANAKQEAKNYG